METVKMIEPLSIAASKPKISRTRPLRVTICWAEVSGYIASCWRALQHRHGVELHIIHLQGLWAGPIPAAAEVRSSFSNTLIDATEPVSAGTIAAIIAETAPDLVVTAGWLFRPYVDALLDSSLREVPLVIGMDSPWEGRLRQRFARYVLRNYLARADASIVAGQRSREYAQRLGFPDARIFDGFYGFDFRRFFDSAEEVRWQSPWQRKFLFAGRYVEEKALDTLIEAYRRYRASSSNPWALGSCGMGPRKSVLSEVEGVTDYGFVEPNDLPALFAEHGAFVMPSRFEPWGVAIAEAAASGMPLVCSTACGAAMDVLRSFHNGLSFAPGDVARLAAAMQWIEDHVSDLPQMGRRSQSLAEGYSAEAWADRWHDCFLFAVENRRS